MHKLSRAGFLLRLCVVSVYTFINFKSALELFAFTMSLRMSLLFVLFFLIGRRKSGAKSHLRVNSTSQQLPMSFLTSRVVGRVNLVPIGRDRFGQQRGDRDFQRMTKGATGDEVGVG